MTMTTFEFFSSRVYDYDQNQGENHGILGSLHFLSRTLSPTGLLVLAVGRELLNLALVSHSIQHSVQLACIWNGSLYPSSTQVQDIEFLFVCTCEQIRGPSLHNFIAAHVHRRNIRWIFLC